MIMGQSTCSEDIITVSQESNVLNKHTASWMFFEKKTQFKSTYSSNEGPTFS